MEIKQTILPPFGGPREESGSNGSLWSMGGGVIGSPGAEDNRVAVPNLIGLSSSAAQNLLISIGLNWGETPPTAMGATEQNDNTVAFQSISAGTLVNPGTTVVYYLYDYASPTVPNLIGLTESEAISAITSAGLSPSYLGSTQTNATAENWKTVSSQFPDPGTIVSSGAIVQFEDYEFISSATTGSVSGFNRNPPEQLGWSLSEGEAVMYVTGRSAWPTIGSTIYVEGTSESAYHVAYDIADVAPDNSYNTGGTAIRVTRSQGGNFNEVSDSSGGTWIKMPTPGVVIEPTNSWWAQGGTINIEGVGPITAATILDGVAFFAGPWQVLGNTYEIIGSGSYNSETLVLTLNSSSAFSGAQNPRGETSTTYPVGDPVIEWELYGPVSVEVLDIF